MPPSGETGVTVFWHGISQGMICKGEEVNVRCDWVLETCCQRELQMGEESSDDSAPFSLILAAEEKGT